MKFSGEKGIEYALCETSLEHTHTIFDLASLNLSKQLQLPPQLGS